LILPLSRWVLQAACETAASWPHDCRVAVNVSAYEFRTGNLPELVARTLADANLSADRLELEVTESLLMDDSSDTHQAMSRLKSTGVRIALDDFGTGYSSLSYLSRFPVDKIKIDRSFIQGMLHDQGCRTIVGAILAMGHELGLRVTAEGIENEAQLDLLRSLDCDEIQGFFLGYPMSARAIADYIAAPTIRESAPSLVAS
jgi:EAL domain-containing protein (putative c-di-GMP-specific phosphodiesterase class I)